MKFNCTEDAIEFGRNASLSQIQKLKKQHKIVSKIFYELQSSGDTNFQYQMKLAVECQFVREAIETYYKEIHNEQ